MVHSEFRDGNVPAGHQQLRLLWSTCLRGWSRCWSARMPATSRSFCATVPRAKSFGVIEFAVGVDVTQEFKAAVARVDEEEWRELCREVGGRRVPTGQQYAEVGFVPNWIGHSKKSPEYRFIALRDGSGTRRCRGWLASWNCPPSWRWGSRGGSRSLEW